MKKRIISAFLLMLTLCINSLYAQDEVKLRDIECVNLGDGRLYCQDKKTEKPLNGKSRLIDGYTTQYIDAEFKEGIPNGSWKEYKYNVLTVEKMYEKGILNGDVKEYYSDGTVKEVRHFVNGKAEGKFITYGQNGKVEKEKGYKNGLEDGAEIVYDNDGKIRSEVHYIAGKTVGKQVQQYTDYLLTANYNKEGKYDGEYSEVYNDGNIKVNGKYVNGKKEGLWEYGKKNGQKIRTDEYSNDDKIKETIYYTDNTVEVVRELKNGKKNGYERKYTYGDGSLKSEQYYENGNLSSAPSGNAKSNASASSSGKTGLIKQTKQITSNVGNYTQTFYQVNGKYESEYAEQYVDGGAFKTKGQYTNGIKEGLWSYENRNGKKDKEENYLNGKLNGLSVKYSGGIIQESQEYKNDIRNGECKQYNVDGKLVLKGNYVNDKRQGPFEEYYPSGKIKVKGAYENGQRSGIWQEFYTNAKTKSETTYSEGSLIGPFKYWNENGQLESEGDQARSGIIFKNTYQNGKLYMKEYKDEDGIRKVEYYDESGKKKN